MAVAAGMAFEVRDYVAVLEPFVQRSTQSSRDLERRIL
jgi:hypothetical protein